MCGSRRSSGPRRRLTGGNSLLGIDEVAPDIRQLRFRPRNAINVYLVGDVVVDAGTSAMRKPILRQLEGSRLSAHVLTHAHPDHYGSTNALCQARGIPVWAGERDAAVVEGARPQTANSRAGRIAAKMPIPDPHAVERRLTEGDEVAGFTVLDTPGHSPGHISLWRESDRTLICGDVLFNLRLPLPKPGLREPFGAVTPDPARNRESARKLAELRPALVLFGHGPPLCEGDRFVRFVEALPRD